MKSPLHRVLLSVLMASALLAGCATRTTRTVSVEDRPVGRSAPNSAPATAAKPAAAVTGAVASGVPSSADAASNAGRPGYYTVRPGDTLVRIGLDHGQNWRDIARWNQIENPNLIEVGQVLRVRPEAVAAAPSTASSSASPAPAVAPPGSTAPRPASPAPRVPAVPTAEPLRERELPADTAREARGESTADVAWAWPAAGVVLQGFDEQRNKGLDIGGKAGDPVLAAADGRVVYAGSALRGYGNLIILKHNATFLSAYAHNQTLLVKEDQVVKRGQKIAEMGNSDAERVQLHFEIRRDGKPTDPARLLPAR